MDPIIGSALISGASSILGGLFGKPKSKYVVPDYKGIRKGAEEAGFNPLTALTQGPQGSVVTSSNPMGTAIADAGLMLADSLAKSKKGGILSKVQSENAELQRRVQNLTLRPKVAGVYGRQQSVPSVPQALGVSSGSVSGSGLSSAALGAGSDLVTSAAGSVEFGPDGLITKDSIDSRRGVDNMEITSDPGYVIIDNPMLGKPFRVPALGGEIIETNQIPTVLGSWALDRGKTAWETFKKNNAPRPRDPAGVLAGKPRLAPSKYARVIPKSPREISLQEANLLRYGQWGLSHFGPLSRLK
jgi:hypothetical protein